MTYTSIGRGRAPHFCAGALRPGPIASGVPGLDQFSIRPAVEADVPAIAELLPLSIHGLQAETYSRAQREAAIGPVFGVDTRLIGDGTYFVVEAEGELIGCGGWSFRATPFGGDASTRDDAELD